MKKICIVSLYGNFNFGNKLQNYAIQKKSNDLNYYTEILRNSISKSRITKYKSLFKIIAKMKNILNDYIFKKNYKNKNFKLFEKNFLKTSKCFTYYNLDNKKLNKKYDYFIVGSDQVWNPNFGLKGDLRFLDFAKNKPKIAFSASFGVNSISKELHEEYKNGINNLDYISVREDAGKKIIEELTGRKNVEVLVDPTMLLSKKEWQEISKKPINLGNEKYILNYFLGELSDKRKNIINEFAKKMGYKIINILDKDDPFYESGPSEFVYLEEHAELICTDSFHSCVFGILMETPFIVFDREDKNENMNSRIDTLLSKFKLEDRKFDGIINDNKLKMDCSETHKILKEEQEKSISFLKESLNYKKR